MHRTRTTFLALLTLLMLSPLRAQEAWLHQLADPRAQVFAVDEAFRQWADSARANVVGRAEEDPTLTRFRKLEKRYLRWRREADTRLNADGTQSYQRAWREFQERRARSGERSQMGTWTCIGPTMDTTLTGLGVVGALAVHPTNDSIMFIGTWSSGTWRTADRGQTWHEVADIPDLSAVPAFDPVDGNVVYLLIGGRFIRSTDGGDTWTELLSEDPALVYGARIIINPQNTQVIDLITYGRTLRTTDGGQTWSVLNESTLLDATPRADDHSVWYAIRTRTGNGNADFLMRSTDGGITFDTLTALPDPNTARAIAVSAADPDRVYVLHPGAEGTGTGRVVMSLDGGLTFNSPSASDLVRASGNLITLEASPTDPDLVFMGGIFLRRSTDGGLTWQAVHQGDFLLPDYMHVDTRAFLVNDGVPWSCNDGGVYRSLDDGVSWEDRTNNLILSPITDFDWSPTDPEVIVFGAVHNAFALHLDGQWRTYGAGDGYNVAVDANDPYHVIGTSQYGHPDVSLDPSLQLNYAVNGITESGYGFSADKPVAIDPSDGDVVYALRQNVFKSTNGGLNYLQVSGFAQDAGGGFLLVHPTATQHIYTAYHRSQDGGATWSSLNPPVRPIRCLTVDPADPDRIWSVGGNLHTYVHHTSDGGATWNELNTIDLPAANGIRIARVENGHDGLLVAQGNALFYIDDRFSNWQPADNGLRGGISDMAVHPISQQAMVATYGRGLWQTSTEVDLDGPPTAAAIASRTSICPGQTVRFFDNSLFSGPGFGSVYQWTFEGGSPATSTEPSPTIQYDAEGVFDVTLVLQTANGADTVVYPDLIMVDVPMMALPWSEGFEDPGFPPTGWFWWDPNQNPYNGWKRATSASGGGYGLSPSSAQFDTPTSLYGWEVLMTPAFDLSDPSGWMLLFDRAYQPSLSPSTYDSLRVYATDICELIGPVLYVRGGLGLGTAEPSNFLWFPDSGEWATDTVFLSGIAPSAHLRFGFAGESNDGNAFFIDNVRLVQDRSTGVLEQPGIGFDVMPNPMDAAVEIRPGHRPSGDAYVDFLDVMGRQVMRVPMRGMHRVLVATGALPDGTYLLRLVDGGSVITRRSVKQSR